ncbi:hypothetical protein JCM15519_38620 [Fundidesulfovibrio butyratiphilus]
MAQEAERVYLAQALARAGQAAPRQSQRTRAGRVVCLDCGEPIPAGRLAAVPGACRCVGCQTEYDEG